MWGKLIILILVLVLIFSIYHYIGLQKDKALVRWKEKELERKAKKEARKIEKAKWKYAKVDEKNILLNHLSKFHIILFWGLAGKGKTLLMNLFSKWLYDKWKKQNRKNKRYNKFMRQDYLTTCAKLENNNEMPVYSNIELTDNDFKSKDINPVLVQEERLVEGGVLSYDEIGEIMGKDRYWISLRNPEETDKRIIELCRFIRHIGGHLLGTEQDPNNLWIEVRRFGYADVHALQTVSYVTKWGKFRKKLCYVLNTILPAFCFLKYNIRAYKLQLFKSDRIKAFLKMFLPNYFAFPKQYYIRKTERTKVLNATYTRFKVQLKFEEKEYWLHFSKKQTFNYDTKYHNNEYIKQFDKEGKRIEPFKNIQKAVVTA